MSILLKMAGMNVLRNPRRSIINLLAIAAGMAGMIFLWSFVGSIVEGVRSNAIDYVTGHVQVRPKDFEDSLSPRLTVKDRSSLESRISKDPRVKAFASRVRAEGLVQASSGSQTVLINGIRPEEMEKVLRMKEIVTKGKYLSESSSQGIMIGDLLADELKAGIGDKIVVMSQDRKGALTGRPFLLEGIFHSGSSVMNERVIFINLKAAQDLLAMRSGVSEILVRLDARKSVPAFENALKSAIGSTQEVVAWEEVVPGLKQFVDWYAAVTRTILFVVALVISIGIMNTVIMSVLERTQEFGVLLALGTRPLQLASLVFAETAILALVGIALGIALGMGIVRYYGMQGISLIHMSEALEANFMNKIVYTSITADRIVECTLLILAVTFLAVIYPAIRSAKLSPIKAIYQS